MRAAGVSSNERRACGKFRGEEDLYKRGDGCDAVYLLLEGSIELTRDERGAGANPNTNAKEARELRQQEANEKADEDTRDLNTPWLDPMRSGDRQFAQDARGQAAGKRAGEEPAWKAQVFNKATTFGKRTNLSMVEQRSTLPIYKFREAIIDAVRTVRRLPTLP